MSIKPPTVLVVHQLPERVDASPTSIMPNRQFGHRRRIGSRSSCMIDSVNLKQQLFQRTSRMRKGLSHMSCEAFLPALHLRPPSPPSTTKIWPHAHALTPACADNKHAQLSFSELRPPLGRCWAGSPRPITSTRVGDTCMLATSPRHRAPRPPRRHTRLPRTSDTTCFSAQVN